MTTLIWKELRENFKWALLAMVLLGLAELYSLYPQNGQPDYYNYISIGITICKTSFLTITTFGCAATGFLLGLIQILPELKQDRWAALLHRPVSRGLIYRSKVVTGLFLYTLATVTPFLLIVWLVATPGHFGAPFLPDMVLPGTADICMGAAYYFAALAVALQRGGWIGLRVLPLFAAIFTSYFVLNEHLFYVAVEAAVLMALALFTAAWGEIHNQNLIRPRPWLGRVAFLAVTFYGVCGVTSLTHNFVNSLGPSTYTNFTRYELSDQGVPLHFTYGKGGVIISVQGLDGKTITDPQYQPDRVQGHMMYLNGFSNYVGNSHGYRPWAYDGGYRQARTYMWANNPYSYPRLEQWFTLVKQNILIGYLPTQKVPFAILDRRGFEPPSATPESFPSDVNFSYAAQDAYCIWDPTRVRYAFLARREMIDLPLPAPVPIYGMGAAFATTNHGSVDVVGVTLGTGIAVYNDKAELVTLVPYHHDMEHWGQLSLGINGALDRFYLRYDPSAWIDGRVKKTMPSYVEEMNLQGQVLHSYTLHPLPDIPNPRSWDSYFSQRLQSPAYYFGTILYKAIGAELGSDRMRGDLRGQFHDHRETVGISVFATLLSLLLGGLTAFLARRAYFSRSRTWAWVVFVFAFSVAGFITFLLTADWPRFTSCPRCLRKRPIEAETCPNCGTGWPEPPTTGIEIIDHQGSAATAPASI